jgi:hypothetical protein
MDIEISYWTVSGHWMVLRVPDQSTSETKINDYSRQNKSRFARFYFCGNYFEIRKNANKVLCNFVWQLIVRAGIHIVLDFKTIFMDIYSLVVH